jgi:transposase
MTTLRKPYPSAVSHEEGALVAPDLTLLRDAGQREHPLREVFNGLRYIVKTGAPWRWVPHDRPPSISRRSGGWRGRTLRRRARQPDIAFHTRKRNAGRP